VLNQEHEIQRIGLVVIIHNTSFFIWF